MYNYDIDKPTSLSKNEKGVFEKLMDESGTVSYDPKNNYANASNNSSEEGKSKSYGHVSGNEDE